MQVAHAGRRGADRRRVGPGRTRDAGAAQVRPRVHRVRARGAWSGSARPRAFPISAVQILLMVLYFFFC